MLIGFVSLYLLFTVAIGLWAATRVKTTADFAVAGRSLPLAMIVTTTFATWFGSETVLGISAKFVQGGLGNVVEDPFGASMCLVLVGLFFADQPVRNYDDAKEAAGRGLYPAFFHGMLERGIALAPGPYEAIFPSLAHTGADIDRTVEAAGHARRLLPRTMRCDRTAISPGSVRHVWACRRWA